ncbi:hypothetical protein PanWU01x14_134740, partial [Parasponia andersonii]
PISPRIGNKKSTSTPQIGIIKIIPISLQKQTSYIKIIKISQLVRLLIASNDIIDQLSNHGKRRSTIRNSFPGHPTHLFHLLPHLAITLHKMIHRCFNLVRQHKMIPMVPVIQS